MKSWSNEPNFQGGLKLDVWLAQRVLAGWHPRAIAAASAGEVNVRTAYRWRRRLVAIREVELGGYVATYALWRDRPPSRITLWEPVRAPGMIERSDEESSHAA